MSLARVTMTFVVSPFYFPGGTQQAFQFITLRGENDLIRVAVMNLDWRQVVEVIAQAIERRIGNRSVEFDHSAHCQTLFALCLTQNQMAAERETEQAGFELLVYLRPAGREA